MNKAQKFGHIAFIGPSNTGKSTLTNRLIGEKVAIVSHKPQTTRFRITALLTEDMHQIAIMDTPGFFRAKKTLDTHMVKAAMNTMHDADIIYLFIDAEKSFTKTTYSILEKCQKYAITLHVIVNKIDQVPKEKLLAISAICKENPLIKDVLFISALKGKNVTDLKKHMFAHIPYQPFRYEKDDISTLSEKLHMERSYARGYFTLYTSRNTVLYYYRNRKLA